MENKDFVIEDGVLTEYTGDGGNAVIPEGVTEIGFSVFDGCDTLESITVPSTVEIISDSAFAFCTNLKTVTVQDGVTEIGEWAFSNCTALESITLPKSVTIIGSYAFDCCTSLKDICILGAVEEIGDEAFSGRDDLVLHAPKGSYAQKYAEEYELGFIPL